mmetsp:Transcript_18721/g.70850  ORF Transcript_18721/g.70850 Transcript_18721/m.70850 type:complete len:101 (+) Transcript_18721:1287-1589(+)
MTMSDIPCGSCLHRPCRLEALLGQKLPAYPCEEAAVMVLQERVSEAQRMAMRELKESGGAAVLGGAVKKKKRLKRAEGDEQDIDEVVRDAIKRTKKKRRK